MLDSNHKIQAGSPPFDAGDSVVSTQTVTSYRRDITIERGRSVTIEHIGLDDCEWYLNLGGLVGAFPASAFAKQS